MEDTTSVRTAELVNLLIQRIEANRADLVDRFRQCLRETVFTNRFEMRPREVGDIAAAEAEILIKQLPDPQLGVEHGANLCQKGLSEQTVLALARVARRFMLAIFERGPRPSSFGCCGYLSKCGGARLYARA